jgi:zinc-ribbon domain
MAFCSNCGNPVTETQKFCAQCGAAVSARISNATASAPAPPPNVPPPPVQPVVTAATPDPAGTVPVAMTALTSAQTSRKKGRLGTVVVILIVAAVAWYYYNRSQHSASAAPANNPPTQPAAPSSPPSGGGGQANAALVKLQTFDAHWQDQSGMLILTTATWTNNSDTNIAAATLQCRQYNAAGTDLSEYRVTLNGPTHAATESTFSNISLGATATGMARVDCTIVHVKPAE